MNANRDFVERDLAVLWHPYQPLLMNMITVSSPDCFNREPDETREAYSRKTFAHMDRALEEHHEEVCAVILEPLVWCWVLGAGCWVLGAGKKMVVRLSSVSKSFFLDPQPIPNTSLS